MRLADIYDFVVEAGMRKDPRKKSEIKEELNTARREFRKLKGLDRKIFDRERMSHPYADTRILYGDPNRDVKTIMAGIDMESEEILLADRLNEHGESIDLIMAHHPEGAAWAGFYDVMRMQAAMLKRCGIPLEVGKELLKDRIEEVRRAVSPSNHFRSVDVARLLDIPFMCVHTPADNHVTDYLQRLFDRRHPKRLSDVVSALKRIPEYSEAAKRNAGPRILVGDPKKDAGRVFVDMTGGTEGPKRIFARLSQAGIGTIVSMHLSEEHFKNAKDEHINIVIAGHIASDSLGLNLILGELERRSAFKIITCSGFIRIKR